MNYLMIYDNGKKPLRFSRKNNGIGICAGSLGTVYPILVPTNTVYAAPLRIKLNNEIKAFASMQSVVLARCFCAITGNDVIQFQSFPTFPSMQDPEWYLGFKTLFYDLYDGLYVAYNQDGALVSSEDGTNWQMFPTSPLMSSSGYVYYFPTEYGIIQIFSDWDPIISPGGTVTKFKIYLRVYLVTLEGNQLLYEETLSEIDPSNYDEPQFNIKFSYKPEKFDASVSTQSAFYLHADVYSCTLSFWIKNLYDETRYDITGARTFYIFKPTGSRVYCQKVWEKNTIWDRWGDTSGPNYNRNLGVYCLFGAEEGMSCSYNGKTWFPLVSNWRKSLGNVNGYEVYENGDGCILSSDGVANSIYANRRVQGYDPVNNHFISLKKEVVYTGEGSHYNMYCHIYTSTNCQNWTKIKTINFGETHWAMTFNDTDAVDMYSAFGFKDD